MNNEEFRKLVSEQQTSAGSRSTSHSGKGGFGAKPGRLGARPSQTARLLASRQFEQQTRPTLDHPPAAKHVNVPKGTKFASTYVDRAQARRAAADDSSADELVRKRLESLDKAYQAKQIDRDTYERRRDLITGGTASTTHLVKGLDRKLLERVRKGEDVLNDHAHQPDPAGEAKDGAEADGEDLDAQLDQLLEKEVTPIERQAVEKKGQRAQKRTRAEILAELKASRERSVPTVQLGSKFRRIGEKGNEAAAGHGSSRVEIDKRGREVLVVTDENGKEKRKVKKSEPGATEPPALPLGHEADEFVKAAAERAAAEEASSSDSDIFEGVGADYDPLGSEVESSGSDGEDDAKQPRTARSDAVAKEEYKPSAETTRDYFGGLSRREDEHSDSELKKALDPLNDPTLLAALKRSGAASKDGSGPGGSGGSDEDSGDDSDAEARRIGRARAKMVGEAADRDLDDFDLDFAGWDGADEDADTKGGQQGHLSRRERARRKRTKGAKDDAGAILDVIKRRGK